MFIATLTALVLGQLDPAQDIQTGAPIPPRSHVTELDGEPTQISVLGTLHLSQIQNFDPAWSDAVVDRLASWEPDLILIESLPPREIDMMQADPAYSEIMDQFASGSIELAGLAQGALGLSRFDARAELDRHVTTADPAMTRRRAALHLANYDRTSAVVAWLALPASERQSYDSLTDEIVTALNTEIDRTNETTLIAARLAHRLGHDRVFAFDSHSDKRAFMEDMDAFVAAFQESQVMAEILSGEQAAALQSMGSEIASPEDLIAALRQMNSPDYAAIDIAVQWASFARADMDGLGRTRIAYWEARNLRMAAHAREVIARHPSSRVLVIVGAAHKPFLDDLFARGLDTVTVDSASLLE